MQINTDDLKNKTKQKTKPMNPSHKQAFKGKTEQRKEQNFNIKQNFTGVTRTDANAAFLALHCRSIPGLLDCRPLNMDYNTVL